MSQPRQLAVTWESGALHDEFIQIMFGSRNGVARKRMRRVPELNLQKTIDTCRSHELTKLQIIMQSSKAEMETVHYTVRTQPRIDRKPSMRAQVNKGVRIRYTFGGSRHTKNRERCPAHGKNAVNRKKLNYVAIFCRQTTGEIIQMAIEGENKP